MTASENENPNNIYLQPRCGGDERTWCAHRIEDEDVCYVRSDLYEDQVRKAQRFEDLYNHQVLVCNELAGTCVTLRQMIANIRVILAAVTPENPR